MFVFYRSTLTSFPGELERTIHRAFLRAANLRRWLARPNCPEAVRQCKTLFDRLYGDKSDEQIHTQQLGLADDGLSKSLKLEKTPEDLRLLVGQSHVALQARLRADNVVYARADTHLGNSLILFYPRGDRSSAAIPGRIQYIYTTDSSPCFAVRRYCTPILESPDPFARWPDFPARIWSTRMEDTMEKVEVSWVFSHCCQYTISEDHVVILDISQVGIVYALRIINCH